MRGHLLPWRSSTMSPHCLRRAALHLPLQRSERGQSYFHHGLLGLKQARLNRVRATSQFFEHAEFSSVS
jgi:hypothetical protein